MMSKNFLVSLTKRTTSIPLRCGFEDCSNKTTQFYYSNEGYLICEECAKREYPKFFEEKENDDNQQGDLWKKE